MPKHFCRRVPFQNRSAYNRNPDPLLRSLVAPLPRCRRGTRTPRWRCWTSTRTWTPGTRSSPPGSDGSRLGDRTGSGCRCWGCGWTLSRPSTGRSPGLCRHGRSRNGFEPWTPSLQAALRANCTHWEKVTYALLLTLKLIINPQMSLCKIDL